MYRVELIQHLQSYKNLVARTIEEDCASVSTSSCPDIPKVVYFILGTLQYD